MTRRPLALLLALPLAMSLAACGGDDGGSEDDPKAAFVDQAAAICTSADEDVSALEQPTAAAQFAPFVEQTIAIAERAQDELAALTPPEQDRAELEERVLDPFAALVEEGRAFAGRVEAAGQDQLQLLPLLSQRPTADDIDLDYLREYGLETCADAIGKLG